MQNWQMEVEKNKAIVRLVDGKVVEMWHEADIWGMMKQIGVV